MEVILEISCVPLREALQVASPCLFRADPKFYFSSGQTMVYIFLKADSTFLSDPVAASTLLRLVS